MGSAKCTDFVLPSYVKVQEMHLIIVYEVQEMNEKKYKKRLEFQQKIISRQSEQIDSLKFENEKLKQKLIEKDEIINTVALLKNELVENVDETKKYKEEYKILIQELKKMKSIVNQEVYKGRWKLIKLLLK